jgi:hypothetical protein
MFDVRRILRPFAPVHEHDVRFVGGFARPDLGNLERLRVSGLAFQEPLRFGGIREFGIR